MPLITGDALSQAAAELSRRNVKLYHACQLADFKSYLQAGGVPSRNLLATKGLPYTTFDTDKKDRQNGVWRLVFFNLSDFGCWFARGGKNLPNIYGPILLCFDPKVMCEAIDVSITLRSAGGKNFDRVTEGIGSTEVPRLFTDPDSQYARFSDTLKKEFSCAQAGSPEMSCSFHVELAHLAHLADITVDPYGFPEGSLPDMVGQAVDEHSVSCRVSRRRCTNGYETRYQVLLDTVLSGVRTASELRDAIPDGSAMSGWRDAILRSQDLSFQFGRFARYLFEGTVRQCL